MRGGFQSSGQTHYEADAIIVGSGAGGASVASVLTEAGLSVLMIEEGPNVDKTAMPAKASQSFPRLWRNAGLAATLGDTIAYAEGRCVGGTTQINSAVFQRTNDTLVDQWAEQYRIDAFSATSLSGYYDRAAKIVNASLTEGALGPPSDILEQGTKALGWTGTKLERGHRNCVGTNMCSYGCPTGAKQAMTENILPCAVERGMRLISDARVTKITRRGARATGIRALATDVSGRRVKLTAEADFVFVCAGAIATPALLQKSGWKKHVGDTLRVHPTIRCLATFDDDINAHNHRLPLYAATEFMPEQRVGGSVFSLATLGMMIAEDWAARKDLVEDWRRAGIYYGMIRGSGTGKVRTLPGLADPIVRYSLSHHDWQQLEQVTGRLRQVMQAAGARQIFPSIRGHSGWSGDSGTTDPAGPVALDRDRAQLMSIHLFSSCPMGEDKSRCPVDSYGRVNGMENLFVADASLIPEAPGCNPQATVMALALRTAEAALGLSAKQRMKSAERDISKED